MPPGDHLAEGARILTICNACRYCEGYCAVFPAMERRLTFAAGDLEYLANLCHDCGECYDACQYAPPHEFAVDVPRTLAQIRGDTWRRHAWPAPLARAYDRNALAASIAIVLSFVVLLSMALATGMPTQARRADFYAVIPHEVMASLFGAAALFALASLVVGLRRFSRNVGEHVWTLLAPAALTAALRDAFALRYLHGGGAGCTHPDRPSAGARRIFHHLTFYGFLLCFAATVVATFYHYALRMPAPYDYLSLPVLLGTVGGIGLLAGPIGFLRLAARTSNPSDDADQRRLNAVLNMMLALTAVTGLLLLALRATPAMPWLLVVHLAIVLAFFVTLPYGKLVHALYRLAALSRSVVESHRPHGGIASDA